MRHNGVAFPPPYEARGLTVKIKDKLVQLGPLQEEMLMEWAKKNGTPYVEDPVFRENFLASLRSYFPETFNGIELTDIDFRDLESIANDNKLSNMPEEKRKRVSAERKKKRDELKEKHGKATVDGIELEVGAYLVEPPGIFMGRGAHPKRGTWKRRVTSQDVELNLDADAPVPEAMDGGQWKAIVHEHDGLWIARWTDELAKKTKYVWLAETSHLRQESEKMKFVKAAKLDSGLERVRAEISKRLNFENKPARAKIEKHRKKLRARRRAVESELLALGDAATRKKLEEELGKLQIAEEKLAKQEARNQAEELRTRQVATAAYLIDRMAMRVGDEKDEDEADTVGASTLRVEHVKIHDDRIDFDFLGKDSVRWEKTLPIGGADRVLARNLREFVAGKQPGDQIFPTISLAQVNNFLSKIQPGLSAKVFRTFHATTTVKAYLEKKGRVKKSASMAEKEYVARSANLQAAIRCNHKRTPPKTWEESLKKKEDALAKLQATEVKTDRARERLNERIEKAQRQLDLARATRDYNLNTSLKNYIDPRVFKAWSEKVDFDWTRLYTQALRRKFSWMKSSRVKWDSLSGHSLARLGRTSGTNVKDEENSKARDE